MRVRNVMLVALLGLSGSASVSATRASETGFLDRTVTVNQVIYRYQVYVPNNWTKNEKWPMVLFLHGAGERGDDGLVQTEVGVGTAIRRYSARFPAVIVFPQCRKTRWWPEEEMEALFREGREFEINLFAREQYRTRVGAFEGAMYEAKGYYRPQVDCIMFSRSHDFCEVCRRAIERIIALHA